MPPSIKLENKAEQHYPTYKLQDRDIVLLEFSEAQQIANSQNKLYGQLTNLLIGVATLGTTILFNKDVNSISKRILPIVPNAIGLVGVLSIFGLILLRYFVELQRQITINARKVVTLRTMLGLDYGNIQLTVPNWRVEGATNPFVIKYFHGWTNFRTFPFWLIFISISLLWYSAVGGTTAFSSILFCYPISVSWGFVSFLITALVYSFVFRKFLNDRHETMFLNFTKLLSGILRIKIVENFEYILYRAKLSFIELDRLKIDYENLKRILIIVEDKTFLSNRGISYRSMIRALMSRFQILRSKYHMISHGGSTITMQLVRSLFIPSNQNKYLRKIIEILLALWINGQFDKNTILKLYVASVRYDRNVLGLANALKHFFDVPLESLKLTNEQSFFLVERLSNVTSTVKKARLEFLASRIDLMLDKSVLEKLYADLLFKLNLPKS